MLRPADVTAVIAFDRRQVSLRTIDVKLVEHVMNSRVRARWGMGFRAQQQTETYWVSKFGQELEVPLKRAAAAAT